MIDSHIILLCPYMRGTKGEHDSYIAVEGADAGYVMRELKTATTAAAALVGGRG
jgi:hypothetical protein